MRKPDIDQEAVYPAADRWVDAALRGDGSLFTPGRPIWTAELLADLRRRFVDQPDESGDRFEVKLERQLAGVPPEVYQLMGEVLFIHLLVASRDSMGGAAKRSLINLVLGWSSDPVSIPPELDDALEHGLAATGIAFLTFRPFQVATIIKFAEMWKELDQEERDTALSDPWKFKELVYRISERGAFAQREALLHFVHPDTYEAIVSRDQKSQIVAAFADLVPDTVTDIDQRLLEMRRQLSEQYGERFSWYQSDVRARWQEDKSPWGQFVNWARRFYEEERFDDTETSYKLKVAALADEARQLIEAPQDEAFEAVKKALRAENLVSHWAYTSFLDWASDNWSECRDALRALWSEGTTTVERLRGFSERVPDKAVKGVGSRLSIASVLLMAHDPHLHPPYRWDPFNEGYHLTGYPGPEKTADEAATYEHSLEFLQRISDECTRRGLELRDLLDAQSILWCVAKGSLEDPSDQAQLERWRASIKRGVPVLTGRAWWVNQGGTYSHEHEGGYIWAPQQTKAGKTVVHHRNVAETEPGDVVVHYANGAVKALGLVMVGGVEAERPEELSADSWAVDGFRAELSYYELAEPIALQEIPEVERIAEVAAFDKTGGVKQGYLFALSPEFAERLSAKFADRWPTESPWSGVEPTTAPDTTLPDVSSVALADVCSAVGDALLQSGLVYGDRHVDLVRSFVVSLATKPLVLLTGLSGSGKTRLAQAFGQWLGPNRYKVVAVRPDWTGPDSLLGYENQLSRQVNGSYAWVVPETLEFMLHAARDKDHPYLLLLDEMNLAHVERYFADVLSGIESGEKILPQLAHDAGEWREVGAEKLPFPPNLFVVGTVNIDETTYMFSPKVLDRANTLEFRVHTGDLQSNSTGIRATDAGNATLVARFLADSKDREVSDEWAGRTDMAGALVALHRQLSAIDREFGHRVFQEAIRFGALMARSGRDEWLGALDLQVMQKVLPRFHGSVKQIAEPLKLIGSWCYFGPDSEPQANFDPLSPPDDEAALPVSFDKIARMYKRVLANHFVSFAE